MRDLFGSAAEDARRSAPGPRTRRRWVAGVALALAAGPWLPIGRPALAAEVSPPEPARDEAVGFAGHPVSEALDALAARGLRIVYTSALVPPEMEVATEPRSREPRRILDEILAPHGLTVQEGPGGILVVVARPGPRAGTGRIEGTVVARDSGLGLPGATVRIAELATSARTDDDGRFVLAPIAPGSYTVEAIAPGYVEQSTGSVAIAPASVRTVAFTLPPWPLLRDEIVVRPSRLSVLSERPDSPLTLGRDEIESLPQLGGDLFRAIPCSPAPPPTT